jgi:hypothetical protein
LVEDWTPEPLVAPPTAHEELDNEKRPVIVGYETREILGEGVRVEMLTLA